MTGPGLVLAAVMLLGGCAAVGDLEPLRLPPAEVPARTGVEPEAPLLVEEMPEYRIYPHDNLQVQVYGHADLNRTVQVSPDGRISFPLIGTLTVGGLTAPEAEKLLEDGLARYLVNPQVTMIAPQVRERITRLREEQEELERKEREEVYVFVSGQVRSPGAYRLKPGMTAYQALTMAGWLTGIAAPNRTRVIRRGADGREEVIIVPVAEMVRRGDMSQDVELKPGDAIVVPESFF